MFLFAEKWDIKPLNGTFFAQSDLSESQSQNVFSELREDPRILEHFC